jgi:uncharacterized protein YkwD
VRRNALLLLVALLASLAFPAGLIGSAGRGGVDLRAGLDRAILAEMNRARQDQGLPPLRPAAGLAAAARRHSLEMARHGFFAHESATGEPFWRRIGRLYPARGYRTWRVGENLAWGSPDLDPEQAVQLWLRSPAHRAILLDPRWREVGLAAVHAQWAPGAFAGRPATVVTADFGLRLR